MGLIRIGEAVNRTPDYVFKLFADRPWQQIVTMRNLTAHQYNDLDPRRVWRTFTRDLPALLYYLSTPDPGAWAMSKWLNRLTLAACRAPESAHDSR